MRLRFLFLFSLFLFLSLISVVHAEGDINITDIPQKLATQLGVSLMVGQILSGFILLMIGLMPTLILTKDKTAHLIVGIGALVVAVALGWWPIWTFAVIIMLIAFGFAKYLSKYGG